ncbi:MAG: UDP-N-acetylmuramate dehydrogenase [Candidatus Aminicenantales bacterium]
MVCGRKDFSLFFMEHVKKPLRMSVWLHEYSSFRIGGPADFFFDASSLQDLKAAVQAAREYSCSTCVIGSGCNLLFDDDGFRGLIIKNSVKGMQKIHSSSEVEVFSGTSLAELVEFCAGEGLEGFEFLAGIPGTVGGAVIGNAGAFGQSIGNFVRAASLLDERGSEIQVAHEYFAFGYRHSSLRQKHTIILNVNFVLRHGDGGKVKARMAENLEVRRKKHPPPDTACAGSFFKNPVFPDGTKVAAGYLLEQAGAKGLRIGGAAVYPEHCNFLINEDRATTQDILCLARELKSRVKEQFGIELEEEVIFLPAVSSRP